LAEAGEVLLVVLHLFEVRDVVRPSEAVRRINLRAPTFDITRRIIHGQILHACARADKVGWKGSSSNRSSSPPNPPRAGAAGVDTRSGAGGVRMLVLSIPLA